MARQRPLTVSDIPVFKSFFKTSGWQDMSVARLVELLPTLFLWKRGMLSVKDAILNRHFGRLMGTYSRQLNRPFNFLYIGANDGITSDTIMKYAEAYGWHGILVEPVPHIMKKLRENYAHLPNQAYEQIAVAEADGEKEFYTFKQASHQPIFAQLLHSFSKQRLLNAHICWGVNKNTDIEAIKVPTLTVSSILAKHRVKVLDLLVIDTEGYDYTILMSINFDKITPKFIKFENMHMSERELNDISNTLSRYSYKITKMRGDYFCTRVDSD